MSDRSLKNIEEVMVGDLVYTLHETSLEVGHYRVTRTMIATTDAWYEVETASGRRIRCSPTHLFMVGGRKKKAEDLRTSDLLMVFADGTLRSDAVRTITITGETTDVYNVEVEQAHTYLTDNMILHHNEKPVED
jgi:intein/homing endonuclease